MRGTDGRHRGHARALAERPVPQAGALRARAARGRGRRRRGLSAAAPIAAALLALTAAACASLGPLAQIVQPPRFEQADQPPDLRVIAPSLTHPAGGAGVTLWLRVTNPNTFGFTLTTLDATLRLDGQRAATGAFPLGLPLTAGQNTVVPIDLTISFADLPGLAPVLRTAALGGRIPYELDGTVGVDAGRFGQPTFGPMPLARGELRGP